MGKGVMARLHNDGKVDLPYRYPNELDGGRNLIALNNLSGHGSSLTSQQTTYDNKPTFLNTVTNPDTANNFGYKMTAAKNIVIDPCTLTLVFDFNVSNYANSQGHNLGGYIKVVYTDNTTQNFDFENQIPNMLDSTNWNKWITVTCFYSITKAIKQVYGFYFYCDYASSGSSMQVTAPKFEVGSSATPYTKAPEDLGLTVPDDVLSFHVDTDVDSYELIEYPPELAGTRNWLLNTTDPTDGTNLVGGNGSYSAIYNDPEKGNVFEISTTATAESYIYSSRTKPVKQSKKYTFSCDIWVNDYVSNVDLYWLSDTPDNPQTGNSYVNVTQNTGLNPARNTWQRITWTFITKANDYTGYIRIDNNGSTVSGTSAVLRATNLKIEESDVQTPYTQAPEDLGYDYFPDYVTDFGLNWGKSLITPEFSEVPDCLGFDGTTGYAQVPASSVFNMSTITLEAIITTPANMGQPFRGIIGKQGGTRDYNFYCHSNDNVKVTGLHLSSTVTGGWGAVVCPFPTPLEPGTTHHIAVKVDSAGLFTFYLDGDPYATHQGAAGSVSQSVPVMIGATDNYWNSLIYEARIWNIARTDSDIKDKAYKVLSSNESGLVGCWRFNEGSGNVIKDSSANKNDAVLTGGTTWSYLVPNHYALSFDGVSNYVDIVDTNSTLSPTNALTVTTKVLVRSIPSSERNFIDKNGYQQYRVGIHPSGYIHTTIQVTDGTNASFVNDYGSNFFYPELNKWYELTYVFDGTNKEVLLYIDGKLFGSISTPYSQIKVSSADLYFCRYGTAYCDAKMAYASIWNTALTQEQIQSYMNNNLKGNESGLIGLWRLDEGEGTIVKDSSPNGNNGTVYGATWCLRDSLLSIKPDKTLNTKGHLEEGVMI